MRLRVALSALMLACSDDRSRTATDSAAVSPAAEQTAADTVWDAVGHTFDPTTARIGDSVGALRLDTLAVRRAIENELVGMVRFEGRLPLTGRTMAHPDYPDWDDPCVEIDLESARQMPRWKGDRRRPWFCFENEELAKRRIGAPLPRRPVSIVVDRFTIHVNLSDAVNEARLLEVQPLDADVTPRRP